MKIKEKLSQGWEYTKAHPGRVIGGTLAAAFSFALAGFVAWRRSLKS